jgi:hypothetical protein
MLVKPSRQSRGNPRHGQGRSQLNIEHYRKLLSTETDQTKRTALQRLPAEEEAKVAALLNSVGGKAFTR